MEQGGNGNGGNVEVTAGTQIRVGGIDSTSTSGSGGSIILESGENDSIEVNFIKAEGGSGGTGGAVDITTASFGASLGFQGLNDVADVQISTAGVSESGSIQFNDSVTLTRDHLFYTGSTNSGDILFDGTLNGNHELRLHAGAGKIQFKDLIGGDTPLSNRLCRVSGTSRGKIGAGKSLVCQ